MSLISPGDYAMPGPYVTFHKRIQDMVVEPKDVWVVSYPKAGK